jgi:hypothetical protein
MTDILIRDIDPQTLKAIEAMASAKSLNIVKKMSPQERRLELLDELNSLASMPTLKSQQTPSLELLLEDRAR